MMECYQAYADYHDMMELCESLLRHVAQQALGGLRFGYQGQPIDLAGEWPRVTLRDAVRGATDLDILEHDRLESLRAACRKRGLDPGQAPTWGKLVDQLMSDCVEPRLVQPVFVLDYPVELSPLAKRKAEDPRLVERFECFLCGVEVGNAFSELNDPDDQRARLEAQRALRAAGDDEAHPLDEDYLEVLEHGLPPTGGLGVGVDRLVMILANAPNLREVILFPHMRPAAGSSGAGPG
jgi:lysyl-tRNA synthetase class 2